jgi:hypothetical protein
MSESHLTAKTPRQYRRWRKLIDEHEKFCREHLWVKGPERIDKVPAKLQRCTNGIRSAVEVFEFKRDKPERYFLYVKDLLGTKGDTLADLQVHCLRPGRVVKGQNLPGIGTSVDGTNGLYYTALFTTWTGQILGYGHVYANVQRSNWGDKRQTVWMLGVNGCCYWGTYYKSAGDYARMTMYKADRKAK